MQRLPWRIRRRIVIDSMGCWRWTGSHNSNGYGQTTIWKRCHLLHRLIYSIVVGRIPDGLTLDHLCKCRDCCNPSHLDAVTARENLLRGNSIQAANAKKTECHRGHPFTSENTRVYRGGRVCRACAREKTRRIRAFTASAVEAVVGTASPP